MGAVGSGGGLAEAAGGESTSSSSADAVHPGAMIEIETRLLVEREGMALVSAVITVAGEVVASGQLTVVSR